MTELDELIECLEAVTWRDVPGVSTPTVAVFTQQVVEAREVLYDRRQEIECHVE